MIRFIYSGNRKPDVSHCRASVSSDRMGVHQCTRNAKIFEKVEGQKDKLGFCRQHSAAYQEERERKDAEARAIVNERRERGNAKRYLEMDCYQVFAVMSESDAKAAGAKAFGVLTMWKKVQEYEAGP